MAWAQEMKNLAADIRTSHKDRAIRLGEIKDETREIRKQGQEILREADAFMKRVRTELNEAARVLKDFLAKSEETRKKDFGALMREIHARIKEIQARIKEIKGETKNFLVKSEEKRMADFKDMIRDIRGDIETIKRSVATTLKSAKDLILSYTGERMDAARYWASIRGGGGAETVAPKRGRPKKK